ncbi:MAG: extracellular solute-binding protein [Pseudomonadota bacterium]
MPVSAERRRQRPVIAYASALVIGFGFLFSGAYVAHAAEPVHGLSMYGALKYPADFTHFDYVNPDAPKGGQVRLGAIGDTFDSFNGFIEEGSPASGVGGIYDTLLKNAADEAFSEYGLLADSVTTPDDRSWVEFTLRPEARWHDGVVVTPDDVVWTFNALVTDGAPFYAFYYGNVAEVKAVDERTVRFDFKPGENRELPLILGQMPILPKHWWESRDFTKPLREPPLGSGPYKVGKFEPGRFVEYNRVEDYWGAALPVQVGQYNFDTLRYDYYRDSTIAAEAFKGGEFDFRAENSSKAWATAYTVDEVETGEIQKKEFPQERVSGMQGFVFNQRRPFFQDPQVRQALAYAFDFEWSNENLFYGQYARTRSYFDNSELSAAGLPAGEELEILQGLKDQIPAQVFDATYAPPSTKGGLRSNLKEAVGLLKSAGWVIKDRKLVNAETNEPLEFELLLISPLFERIALPFAENLKRIGIDMRVRTVDTAQYIERLRSFDYDMIVSTWGQSASPGNEQREFWSSEAADRRGSRNFAGLTDPAIDALVEKVIAAPSRDSLVQRVRALDRVLQWKYLVIPHWHSRVDRMVYWNKFGIPDVIPKNGVQFNAWWVDPELEKALPSRVASVPRK